MKDIHPNLVICNINCRGVIEQLLTSAKESIIIQTQYITDDALRTILKTKKTLPEFKLLVADTSDNDELIRYFGNEYARKFKTKIGVVYEMDKVNTVLSQKKSNSQSEIDLGEIIFNYSIGNISKSQKILFESSKYDFVKWEDDYIQITDE